MYNYLFKFLDICSSSDSHFGDKCYRKTRYNGPDGNKTDWYNGETYCRQSDIQGDIAYSYLDDDTLINDIINLVDGSKVCVQLWLGVRNRIWFWIAGKFKKRISELVSEKSLITHRTVIYTI